MLTNNVSRLLIPVPIFALLATGALTVSRCPYQAIGALALGHSDCGVPDTCAAYREERELPERLRAASGQTRNLARESGQRLVETPLGTLWFPDTKASDDDIANTIVENQENAYSGTIRKGDVVLDVGGHVGTFALRALAAGASRVVSVEPSPDTAESLRRNLAAPIRSGTATVVEKAAWSSSGELEFFARGGMGDTIQPGHGGRKVTVQAARLDDIVTRLGLERIDLVKIDTEGAEIDILEGAAGTIRRFHPRLAVITEHKPEDLTSIPALIDSIRVYPRRSYGKCIYQPLRKRASPEFILFDN
ncbi:MAG: FkbM family methyltransferase [Bryobacteraceae bacterium]